MNETFLNNIYFSDYEFLSEVQQHPFIKGMEIVWNMEDITYITNQEDISLEIINIHINPEVDERIKKDYPYYKFLHSDIFHPVHNPEGKTLLKNFVLPFDDSSFDIIVIKDFFTELSPMLTVHLLKECHRVLKPKKLIATGHYVAFDKSLEQRLRHYKVSLFNKDEERENTFTKKAYYKEQLFELYAACGFKCREPIIHGVWQTEEEKYKAYFPTLTDVVVSQKIE